MLCPIAYTSTPSRSIECSKEGCSWWDCTNSKCSVKKVFTQEIVRDGCKMVEESIIGGENGNR